MQHMVDANDNLQSKFSETDPEIIADKIVTGLKEITWGGGKKRVQVRARGFQFWTGELEKERKEVEVLNRKAIESKDMDDIRVYKHKKNKHIKNIKKVQKEKIKEMANNKERWKCL